jgi:SAM-dependent methyltransferase
MKNNNLDTSDIGVNSSLRAGDFTGLASDYSLHRPDYSPSVLNGLLGLINKGIKDIDFVDIGAGTGIWTRMVQGAGVKTSIAIEPNDDMRINGIEDSQKMNIRWLAGSAENTGLQAGSADLVSMASSFHWANFDLATQEFHRILRPMGRFVALWNPRLIEVNPLLVEIENQLSVLHSDIKRVSSGRSGITGILTDKLLRSPYFEDVVYLEGRHVISMTPERYLGVWRSVNDLRVQLGSYKFDHFLSFIADKVSNLSVIEATYLTRAWSARRKD